jgi:uncharacterized protein YraI
LPRRPIAQRLASPAAKEQEPRPGVRQPPWRTAHRFAPRNTAAPPADAKLEDYTPLLRSLTGPFAWPRSLIAGLILLALLPNLTVIALLWFPAARTYWSKPTPAVEAAAPPNLRMTDNVRLAPPPAEKVGAVLTAPTTLEVKAGDDVAFPLELDGTDGVPVRSTVAISGLPPGTSISNGRPYGATEWNLKTDEIGDLHLVVADDFAGETKVRLQLVAPDGEVLGDAETALKVAANPAATSLPPASENAVGAADTVAAPEPASPQPAVPDAAAADAAAAPAAAKPAEATAAAVAPSEAALAPSAAPATVGTPDTAQANDGTWIKPSEYLNLRDGPSSSSKIIGVAPEGTKLKVIGRRRRWVQVTNPDTAETGWVYGRYVDGLPGGSAGSAKRPRRKDSSDSDSDDSMWTRLGRWLTGS